MEQGVMRSAAASGTAAGCDILLNYPLWILSKRMSAGMGVPALRELYKGGGGLWCSVGPTTILEEGISTKLSSAFSGGTSAMVSGCCAGLMITSQVENCITKAHKNETSLRQAIVHQYKTAGMKGLMIPNGIVATALREIPFAGCLFFLRNKIRDTSATTFPSWHPASHEVCSAILSASVAGPSSQPFAVLAAHQQAHDTSIRESFKIILGEKALFRGLLSRTASITGTLLVIPMVIESLA
eukprot:TRINITY_DN36920_c0_g1_i1.p1 TRINITY_DN36920_c0_g1~~TRINITY_DN36920_c0_g1_i1.p1  ORF type:complete len:241 (+),score=28.34 TRINITY_DN36920_c0_g1_i1:35-757(+)